MFNERVRRILEAWTEEDKVELNLNSCELTKQNRQMLGHHCLTMKSIKLMSDQLHSKVTHLKLNGNELSSQHLKVLFKSPKEWNLRVLHLANNQLIDADIQLIAKHKSLQELDLSCNQALTCSGISALSDLRISTLNLCTN